MLLKIYLQLPPGVAPSLCVQQGAVPKQSKHPICLCAQAFVDYLEERGVTAELGEYIRLFAEDKTSVEYQAWLQRVQNFIVS